MFTGIVEEMGRLLDRADARFVFEAHFVHEGMRLGDSLAHNGVCLTVIEMGPGRHAVEVSDETLARSNLGDLRPGDPVNLERPVRLEDRLGGHLVQGHVDGVGVVIHSAPDLEIRMPDGLARYVVEKGSITVDGVSLTVVTVKDDLFRVAVIPHTAEHTTLGRQNPGARVNLEVDVIAKYVERLLGDR